MWLCRFDSNLASLSGTLFELFSRFLHSCSFVDPLKREPAVTGSEVVVRMAGWWPMSPGDALAGAGPRQATARSEEYGTSEGRGNWRYEVMTLSKRWQDYATMVFGLLLIISPFVFGETSHHLSSIGAYVLGALLVLSGIVAAVTREARRSLIVNAPGIAAVITFIAAIVLGFAGVPGIAWTAGVVAILTVLVGATLRMGRPRTQDN